MPVDILALRAESSDPRTREEFCSTHALTTRSFAAYSANITRAVRLAAEEHSLDPEQLCKILIDVSKGKDPELICRESGLSKAQLLATLNTAAKRQLISFDQVPTPEETPVRILGGAHADYDNPIKNRWRAAVMEFIEKNTTAHERQNKLLVCLPSRNPDPELSRYLELGFLPQNILAVESDPAVFPEMEARCRGYGVTARYGQLREVLHNLKQPVGVLNYDATGPWCNAASDTLAEAWLERRALVITNFMAARESNEVQTAFEFAHPEVRRQIHAIRDQVSKEFASLFGSEPGIEEAQAYEELLQGAIQDALPKPGQLPVATSREGSLRQAILNKLSAARTEPLGTARALVQEMTHGLYCRTLHPENAHVTQQAIGLLDLNRRAGAQGIFGVAANALKEAGRLKGNPSVAQEAFGLLARLWMTATPLVKESLLIRYRSPVHGKNTPFSTNLIALERPDAVYRDFQATGQFLCRVALATIEDYLSATRHKHPYSKLEVYTAEDRRAGQRSDTSLIVTFAGKEFARIKLNTLARDFIRYRDRLVPEIIHQETYSIPTLMID